MQHFPKIEEMQPEVDWINHSLGLNIPPPSTLSSRSRSALLVSLNTKLFHKYSRQLPKRY